MGRICEKAGDGMLGCSRGLVDGVSEIMFVVMSEGTLECVTEGVLGSVSAND